MEEYKSTYPLIHNKVTSPHYVTPTLRRARLLDWLNANASARAIVIAAGAGYGKTTLLWQWEREVDFPCYWYKLDRNDRDWTLHISYLVEAIGQHYPGFGRRTHSVLRQMGGPGSSRPGVAAFLLAEMHERLTEPCTFIIDDWQFVASVTEVRGLWNQILRDAPPTCRFVFASRGKPHLQFARFKTHAGYAELRTKDLRVTPEELDQLFRDVYRNPLSSQEATELERRTEGWPAGIQLVEVSLRGRKTPTERRELIESLTATSDSDLFAFLAEEVLDQQSEETRNFLLSTAILQQITPGLAERLAGVHNGVRHLLQLEHAGLFTYRLDESRYRYHGLFREFLERRLVDERSETDVIGLHIHAASYFETSAQWPEAIYHYLKAGLQRQAARLIARYGEDVVGEGRLGMVDEWLRGLPSKTIHDNARLSLLQGEALGIVGEWDQALAALSRARTFFAHKNDWRMESLSLLKESSVYHLWGKPVIAAETAKQGLEKVPEGARDLRLRLRGNLAITSMWLYEHLDHALATISQVTSEAAELGLDHYVAIGRHNLGALLFEMGDLDRSIESLERAAKYWGSLPPNPFADNLSLVRAHIAAGHVEQALETARLGVERTRSWRWPQMEAVAGLGLALAASGHPQAALDRLRPFVVGTPDLGVAAETARIHYLELSIESGVVTGDTAVVAADLRERHTDPRLDAARESVLAVLDHLTGNCADDCGDRARVAIEQLESRGARWGSASCALLLGPVLLDHKRAGSAKWVVSAIATAREMGVLPSLAPRFRLYHPFIELILRTTGGQEAIRDFLQTDSAYWMLPVIDRALGRLPPDGRSTLLTEIEKRASSETPTALERIPGSDIAALRLRLLHRHAPRLFIRTFGSLAIHRGSWTGPVILVTKRRTRALLGLLAAHNNEPVSRDLVLDSLWPESDPGAAVNSLNQTLFQLRRTIDPGFRDGRSPQYVISTSDSLQLDSDLVRFDWLEVLRRSTTLRHPEPERIEAFIDFLSDRVHGEFLADLRYEDWATGPRVRVHEELRRALLPATTWANLSANARARLARSLIALDEFDEGANIALALALADEGRISSANAHLRDLTRKLREQFDEEPSRELADAALRITEGNQVLVN